MIIRTFIDKCNTIFKDSDRNLGLNPIGELNYGGLISRCLIHFDTQNLKNLYTDGVITDLTKLKHTLKLTNCGNVGGKQQPNPYNKKRASSFELIYFQLPMEWDGGVGSSLNADDFWISNKELSNNSGANWYRAKTHIDWDNDGVYTYDLLYDEYNSFMSSGSSIILGVQKFDYGNEDFEVDISEVVNDIIENGNDNFGIGIAFAPAFEAIEDEENVNYVGFFTNHTNTIFKPCVISEYDDFVDDDRYKFYTGKSNKLYLYTNINGTPTNLDELPICTISDITYSVVNQTKGVYYAIVDFDFDEIEENTILFDIWSGLTYNSKELPDIEKQFVVLPNENYFNFNINIYDTPRLTPTLSGVKKGELIKNGETRIIKTIFRIPYTNNQSNMITNCKYRIYTQDGQREYELIPYHQIERMENFYFFKLMSDNFLPGVYYIDISVSYGMETILYKNVSNFEIKNDITVDYR